MQVLPQSLSPVAPFRAVGGRGRGGMLGLVVLLVCVAAALGTSTMSTVATGSSVFYTHHADDKCQREPYAISTPRLPDGSTLRINQCSASTASTGRVKVQCKLGASKYSLSQLQYADSDTTCAAAPVTQSTTTTTSAAVLQHDYRCRRSRSGGHVKIHCGEDTSPLLLASVIVSPKPFMDSKCTTPARASRSARTSVCTPSYVGPSESKPTAEIAHNYKVVVTQALPLLATLTKFPGRDVNCTGPITSISKLVYTPSAASSSSSCLADPLHTHPQLYYSLQPAAGLPYANLLPTAAPTPRPSPRPTPRPTVTPPQLMPISAAPTSKPTPEPTPKPTAEPTFLPALGRYYPSSTNPSGVLAAWDNLLGTITISGSFQVEIDVKVTQSQTLWANLFVLNTIQKQWWDGSTTTPKHMIMTFSSADPKLYMSFTPIVGGDYVVNPQTNIPQQTWVHFVLKFDYSTSIMSVEMEGASPVTGTFPATSEGFGTTYVYAGIPSAGSGGQPIAQNCYLRNIVITNL